MNQTLKLTAATSLAALGTAFAHPHTESGTSNGDWCTSLKDFGMFHKDSNASFIQELKFFGRFQWQVGSVDAEGFDRMDYDNSFTEIRRFRIGTQVKFLDNFKLKVNANLEDGGPNNHSFGYHSLDEAKLTYSVNGWSITYGRQKFKFSQEAHTSSKKIKTIELSNLANYFYGSRRPTGVTVEGKIGNVETAFSVFSTDEHHELAQWGEGLAYYANAQFEVGNGNVNLDFLYNDASNSDVDTFDGIEWGISAAYTTTFGEWDVMANVIYGEKKSGDSVCGFIIMPSTFLIEDKLEFVARYQYAGSDGDNLKLTSRYARRADKTDGKGVLGAKGNKNHTLYAGLNYYLCNHNSKFQLGVEYETMEQRNDDSADAITGWFAYRMYF